MLDNTILTVSVPATSANIGVGYITLGLAFNLRAKVRLGNPLRSSLTAALSSSER